MYQIANKTEENRRKALDRLVVVKNVPPRPHCSFKITDLYWKGKEKYMKKGAYSLFCETNKLGGSKMRYKRSKAQKIEMT